MKLSLTDRIWRRFVSFFTALTFMAAVSMFPVPESEAMSLSEEKELGRKMLELIRQKMTLVEDGEIVAYVQSVGNRIVKQVGTTPYEYQFFVVDAPIPNAFAVPGGYIFLYRGLVEIMSTEGELASILGHELAHIQARHIQRQMEKGRILNIASLAGMLAAILLGSTADGGAGAQVLALGSMAGARSVALKYSREHEEEADQLGFRYFCASGYTPLEMPNAMQKLNQASFYSSSTIPSYLSTHPNVTDRVQGLQLLARNYKDPHGKRPERSRTEGDFPFMQAALMAEYSKLPDLNERFEAGAAKGDVPSIYGMGRLHLKNGRTAEAVAALQQAARQSSGSTFVLSTLGSAYLQQGKLEDARKVLESALRLDPSASIVHLRLARVLQEMGQKEEALRHLRQIENLSESFPEIDHQLGIILGQTDRLADAHYHLGRYYFNRMDPKLALFHFKKAQAMPSLSATRMAELDSLLKVLEKKDEKKSPGAVRPRR